MKLSTTHLLIVATLFIVTLDSNGQAKKYDIKSCTIMFEMTQRVAGMDIKNKVVLSFDDYGMKECRETYTGDKISEVYFSDGKDLYSLKPDKKTAFKRGPASSEHDCRRQDMRILRIHFRRNVHDVCPLEPHSVDA
jgi:hypothetical protein